MRQRAEDERASVQMCVVMSDEAHVLPSKTRHLSLSLVGAGEMERERRMAHNEGAQLAAGIAGRAEHPNGKFMHRE